jgi:nicotinate dehydrogenase subunit B
VSDKYAWFDGEIRLSSLSWKHMIRPRKPPPRRQRIYSSGIKSLDWASYPVITFQDVPEIDIVLINRPDMPPLGGGEPSIGPVPAAIANAVFDAVGVRLRQIPLTPQRVVAGLNNHESKET